MSLVFVFPAFKRIVSILRGILISKILKSKKKKKKKLKIWVSELVKYDTSLSFARRMC